MRVLVTTTGGAGHFGPLVPFAEAVRAAGGDVVVATRKSMAGSVAAAGHEVRAFADAPAERRAPFFQRAMGMPFDDANVLVVSEIFARLDAGAALPGVLEACETWRPDVVLSEICEFAGPIAAEKCGLPAVSVGIGLVSLEKLVMEPANAALEDLRAGHGLAPRPSGELPYFTLTPPLMEDPTADGTAAMLRFRERAGAAPRPLPDWWDGSDAPLVYLTFGSVVPQMPFFPGVYRTAIDALADLDARVLVTIGRDRDPGEIGPLPANTHVAGWVPQADVMPHVAAMVSHGGFGTVRAGLSAGVPMAVLPLFADQPYNARRVAELGAGIAVEGGPPAAAGLGDTVRALLADASYGERAALVADDVRTLPTVDRAVELMSALAVPV